MRRQRVDKPCFRNVATKIEEYDWGKTMTTWTKGKVVQRQSAHVWWKQQQQKYRHDDGGVSVRKGM